MVIINDSSIDIPAEPGDSLRAGVDAELPVDATNIGIRRVVGDAHFRGDGRNRLPFCKESQNLSFVDRKPCLFWHWRPTKALEENTDAREHAPA